MSLLARFSLLFANLKMYARFAMNLIIGCWGYFNFISGEPVGVAVGADLKFIVGQACDVEVHGLGSGFTGVSLRSFRRGSNLRL